MAESAWRETTPAHVNVTDMVTTASYKGVYRAVGDHWRFAAVFAHRDIESFVIGKESMTQPLVTYKDDRMIAWKSDTEHIYAFVTNRTDDGYSLDVFSEGGHLVVNATNEVAIEDLGGVFDQLLGAANGDVNFFDAIFCILRAAADCGARGMVLATVQACEVQMISPWRKETVCVWTCDPIPVNLEDIDPADINSFLEVFGGSPTGG